MSEKPDVDAAYALNGTDDVKALYRDWARTYDADFIDAMGYIYPTEIARIFSERRQEGDAPALDIGCGSGAVAEAVAAHGRVEIDGLDLSPEMLAVARAKGLYRDCIEGDLLARLPIPDAAYGALLSAGTFTHGHVGPAALEEILRVARPGAFLCLGINAEHFQAHGFGAALDGLAAEGRIGQPDYVDCPVYTGTNHDHAAIRALVAVFRKT
jgi:SAM-dependent methyltransferase